MLPENGTKKKKTCCLCVNGFQLFCMLLLCSGRFPVLDCPLLVYLTHTHTNAGVVGELITGFRAAGMSSAGDDAHFLLRSPTQCLSEEGLNNRYFIMTFAEVDGVMIPSIDDSFVKICPNTYSMQLHLQDDDSIFSTIRKKNKS